METLSAEEATNLVTQFLNRGPLYNLDSAEINKFRDSIFKRNMTTAALGLLHPFMMNALAADDSTTPAGIEYADAYRVAQTRITSSSEFASLTQAWSNKDYQNLVRRFEPTVPIKIIDSILRGAKAGKYSDVEWFTPVDLLTFKELEKRFFDMASDIPKGLGYESAIWDVLKVFLEEGHATFVLMRANSIDDLIASTNPMSVPDIGDNIRGHLYMFFRWLSHQTSFDPIPPWYTQWLSVITPMVEHDINFFPLITVSLPYAGYEVDDNPIHQYIEIAASVLAALVDCGIPNHIAEDLTFPIFHGLVKDGLPPKPLDGDQILRRWLWGAGQWAHSPNGVMSQFSFAMTNVVNFCEKHIAPFGFIQAASNVVSTIGVGLYTIIDRCLELIFLGINDYTNVSYVSASNFFYSARTLTSGLLPEARRRRKPVWGLLPNNSTIDNLTKAEMIALGYNQMITKDEAPDYYTLAQDRINLIRSYGVELDEVAHVPIRRFTLPKKPTVANEEFAAMAPLMPDAVNTEQATTEFVAKLHSMGVPPGIDGTWFALDDRIAKSVHRYDVESISVDDQVRTRALMAAHALADKFPDMYRSAVYLTPQAAANKIKMKGSGKNYSPGLPFIPNIRTRGELLKIGAFRAIVSLAEKYLQEGIHPGSMAHCFVKSDIVGLQKLLDGKNIRTIIAADLLSNIIQYVTTCEVTRRQPAIDSFVMNAVPRSEGGFRPFYDELRKMKDVIMADASEFDSKLPPVISVDALAELRSIGYDGSVIQPIAVSQIWATYIALRHAALINLADGSQLPHTQGLMTGQGNTSVDNRDAFRIIIITAWSIITNKPPEQFWDDNIIGNAGDDDAIGTNTPEIWPAVIDYIRTQFGMVINIEAQGFDSLALVGLQPIPVPQKSVQYYEVLGYPVPEYSIAGSRIALLAKRTEYRVRVSRFRDVAFLMKHVEGLVGSALLTAHIHDIYTLLMDEYKIEMSQIMLRFFKSISFKDSYDSEGDVVGTLLELGSPRDRYRDNVKAITLWLKGHRWPTYRKVMEVHLKPQDVAHTKMAKDHRKLLTWNPEIPLAEKFLYGLIRLRQNLLTGIPNHVARALPDFKGLDPTYLMRNPNYPIAKFVWLSLYHKRGNKVPKAQLFLTVLKENPYGSAEDGIGFLNWLTNDNNLSKLTTESVEEYRAQIVFITIIYWYIETGFVALRTVPILSILFNLYTLSTRDINRLYSFLNFIHFVATGRSSSVISNMMPADPYAWIKQFSAIMSLLIPRKVLFYVMPGLRHIVSPLPKMVELWAAGDSVVFMRPFRLAHDLINIPAHWADTLAQMRDWILDPNPGDARLVVAPTGTGKSTAFVGAIISTGFSGTIWILCPTIVARDEYDNPFILSGLVQILMKDIVNEPDRRVKVLTYDHGNIRIPREGQPTDLIVYDEQHMGLMEMWRAWFLLDSFKRVAITATPVAGRMPIYNHRINYPGLSRFNVVSKRVNLPFQDLVSVILSDPKTNHLMSRALIVVPTIKMAELFQQTLNRISLSSSILSSYEPDVKSSGIIIATTIVDQAVTIKPDPTCLIDIGLRVQIEYNGSDRWLATKANLVPTGPSDHRQRGGRVGRGGDSIAFVMPEAGTGSDPLPRVTPFGLLLNPDIVINMLVAFNISNPILKQTNDYGLLAYIVSSPDIDMNLQTSTSWALALFIWIMQSDLQDVESIHHIWLDLKVERSEYEIINLVMDSISNSNFGDILAGSWDLAIDILNSNSIGVFIKTNEGERFYGCTGLYIASGIIVPIGVHPGFAAANFQFLSNGGLTPHNAKTWIGWQKFLRLGENYEVSIPALGDINWRLIPHSNFDTRITDVSNNFFYEVVLTIAQASRSRFRSLSFGVVYIRAAYHLPFEHTRDTYRLVTDLHAGWAWPTTLDLRYIPSTMDVDEIVLSFCIAAGLPDDLVLVWGNSSSELNQLATSYKNLGFVMDPNRQSWLLSPRYARSWANNLYSSMIRGDIIPSINLIPKRVLVTQPFNTPLHGPYDVLINLTGDGKIIGVLSDT